MRVREDRRGEWEPVYVRLRPEERQAVARIAAEEDRSLSAQVRIMVRRGLELAQETGDGDAAA
jgi:hypothetical protein